MLAVLLCRAAWAIEPFTITDIRIEGLERISLGTALNYLPIKTGETLDDSRASTILRELYKTGFFEDVKIARDNGVLVIRVTERPSIASIEVTGNEVLKTEDLDKALKDIGLTEGRIFNRTLLDQIEQELHRQYFALGQYGIRITTTITAIERNRVEVAVKIDEGETAKIRSINIIGNQAFDEYTLLDEFALTTPGFWSPLSGSGKYTKQEYLGDLETLRSYYNDRGYMQFSIDSTQVSITPDKRDIYITINVDEGAQYTVRDVMITGNLVVPHDELMALVTLRPGDIFSRRRIIETNEKIAERLGIEGYAFANVNPIPDINEEDKTVGLTFFVDPGKRVYVRRVNITGNTKTSDEVIRREIRQMEGGWLSTPLVDRSKIRLQKLGFFDNVNVSTLPVPETQDQVDLTFDVTEGSTGNFTAGLGYGDSQGLILNLSVALNNFLGTGKQLSAEATKSGVSQVYSFNYDNPYYTPEGISRGFGFYYRKTDTQTTSLADYVTDSYGANITYGFPISEYNRASLSLGYDHTDLTIQSADAPIYYSEWVADNGDQFDTLKATLNWSHDTRNRAIFPDRGFYTLVSTELALPGGDLQYYKVNLKQSWYHALTQSLTLKLGSDLGYAGAYGDTGAIPFFEHYFVGGSRTLRGFSAGTLGPRDTLTNEAIGGTRKVAGNIELILPASWISDDENSNFRLSAFIDIGNVYASDENIDLDKLRAAGGLALNWITPIGPLGFSWAWPLKSEPDDDTESFQFTLGTLF